MPLQYFKSRIFRLPRIRMVLECSAIHAEREEIFNSLEAIRFCPLTLFISENFIIGLLYPAVPSMLQ